MHSVVNANNLVSREKGKVKGLMKNERERSRRTTFRRLRTDRPWKFCEAKICTENPKDDNLGSSA